MQQWAKKGLIYSKTRAQVPVVFEKSPTIWRIYFSDRDSNNCSKIKYIDVEAGKPDNVLNESKAPVLPLGKPGDFDVAGTMPSWILKRDDELWLYYLGWTLRKDIPYYNYVGLAVSKDNGDTFSKAFPGPILGPTHLEPGFTGTICIVEKDDYYLGYYLYCTEWDSTYNPPEPRYRLNVAQSKDGIVWTRNNTPAVDFTSDMEGGIVKASVIKTNLYRMWYSYRDLKNYRTDPSCSYKIGYAESIDGFNWDRKDFQIQFTGFTGAWDMQMQCYPHVIKHNETLYMFYNGNNFGETGLGYAILR